MDTTLSDGQNLIMDKLSYRFHEPERYDIVIFPGPEEYGEHPYYIKRIIGLPGETVQIKKGSGRFQPCHADINRRAALAALDMRYRLRI